MSVSRSIALFSILLTTQETVVVEGFSSIFSAVARQSQTATKRTPSKTQTEPSHVESLNELISLDIYLDVGAPDHSHQDPRLVINKLQLDLTNNDLSTEALGVAPLMPGIDGPYYSPNDGRLSSGKKSLKITENGQYIDMSGLHHVTMSNGCWELNWREDSPSGNIICGFNIPQDIKRNDNMIIPKGSMLYMGFPVWTSETLNAYQNVRNEKEKLHKKYENEKNIELNKMGNTINPLKKALHYRNAMQITEKQIYINAEYYTKNIPALNDDAIDIGKNLKLTTKGTIWIEDKNNGGKQQQIVLGAATIKKKPMVNKLMGSLRP